MRSRVHDTLDTASQMIHDKFCGGVCSAAHLEIESLRDAQATIAALQEEVDSYKSALRDFETERALPLSIENAALQARVQELEQAVKETHGRFISEQAAKKDVIEELTVALKSNADGQVLIDKLMQDVLKLEAQLTQRTAELEATEKAYQDKTRLYIEQTGAVADLQAELERVSALVKALPKVEGEIAVKETEIDLAAMWGITVNGLFGEHSPLFDTKEEADAYAALLQHRQGMEG